MTSLNGTGSSLHSEDRKLHYRSLLEDLCSIEDESDNQLRIQKTENVVKEVQILLANGGVEERAKHPGEGYLDSKVLRATSDLAVRCSESVSGNANLYDRHELAQHIKHNAKFWELRFPSEVPVLSYLYGTFAPTPLEKRPRAPRRHVVRQQAAALKAPESVDKIEKTEGGSEMVSRVHKFVRSACARGPLSYFHCALDPTSFSRTVENIYHLSFLVRDGLISVQLDKESGIPFIKPVAAEEQDESRPEHQFIVSLDMRRWKDLVKSFDIKKPLMTVKRH